MGKYKIGQLSKTMGVSTHLLKHYEKFNLVSPMKDDSTNYRYYDIRQCSKIIEAKKFRNMGVPIKETSEIVNSMEFNDIKELIQNQVDNLEEELKKITLQKEYACRYLNDCKEMLGRLNQWFIEQIPAMMFLSQSENKAMLEESGEVLEDYNLIDYVPISKSAIIINKSSHQGLMEYHWGIVIDQVNYLKQQESLDERMLMIPEQRYFVTYIKVPIPYIDNRVMIDEITHIYRKYQAELNQNIIAIKYQISHEEEKEIHYFKVLIPLV